MMVFAGWLWIEQGVCLRARSSVCKIGDAILMWKESCRQRATL